MAEENGPSAPGAEGETTRPKIRPRKAMVGYIDSDPILRHGKASTDKTDPSKTDTDKADAGKTGTPRFYARVGEEHHRREADGSFTKLGTTFHDMVMFRATAERAKEVFAAGDYFVAQGYIREYTDAKGAEREEFVAVRIGHDLMRTPYTVDRAPAQEGIGRDAPQVERSQAFERDDRPAQRQEPAVSL